LTELARRAGQRSENGLPAGFASDAQMVTFVNNRGCWRLPGPCASTPSSNRPAMKSELAGQCLCGAVHYAVKDEFVYAKNCHCSRCRRATGSAFKPFAGIERDKLRVTHGRDNLLIYGDEQASHNVLCKTCGSLLFSVVRDGQFVHVTLGTLDDTPALQPTAHIFAGSKAAWYSIDDALPQFDEFD
jgi:hypothetical protein